MAADAQVPSVDDIAAAIQRYIPTFHGANEAARAILALFAPILAEKERVERNRDMWKGQCERQAQTLLDLRMQMLSDEGQSRERG